MRPTKTPPVVIGYRRSGELVRLTLKNVTNHELREVILGLWCRLDEADRADHLMALHHYRTDPEAWLSPVATVIKAGPEGESAIDLLKLVKRGERVTP